MNSCCCCGKKPLELKIKKGESKGFAFTLSKNGQPLDLSGNQMLMQVRENLTDDGVYLIEKTISENSDAETQGLISDAANGKFYFKVNESDIENMSTTKPYYVAIYHINGDICACISAKDFQTALFLVLNP